MKTPKNKWLRLFEAVVKNYSFCCHEPKFVTYAREEQIRYNPSLKPGTEIYICSNCRRFCGKRYHFVWW